MFYLKRGRKNKLVFLGFFWCWIEKWDKWGGGGGGGGGSPPLETKNLYPPWRGPYLLKSPSQAKIWKIPPMSPPWQNFRMQIENFPGKNGHFSEKYAKKAIFSNFSHFY